MRPTLTLEGLEVIDAIERQGSYASAAAMLNKVPSAISYTVQKLEQDLGVTLFQRQGRRAVLTAAGRLLVEQGRQLLSAAEELAASTRQAATGWEPLVRIALDSIAPISLLFPIIDRLYTLHPGIEVKITEEVLGGSWEALREDRADLVVGAIGGITGTVGIRCEEWMDIEHVFVAAPHHPVCELAQPLGIAQVQPFRSVVVADTSKNTASLSRGILNREQRLYVPGMREKIAAHKAGLGIGFAPRYMVTEELSSGELVELAVEPRREPESSMLAWKSANHGRALTFLVDELLSLDGVL